LLALETKAANFILAYQYFEGFKTTKRNLAVNGSRNEFFVHVRKQESRIEIQL